MQRVRVRVFFNLCFSSSCHPDHGPGHHPERGVQLAQQISAHHHDVQQRR